MEKGEKLIKTPVSYHVPVVTSAPMHSGVFVVWLGFFLPHILLGIAVESFRGFRVCRNLDIIVSGKLSSLAHFALWKIFVPAFKHSSLSLLHQQY